MKWIFGLGNPGHRYRQTRHNVGFSAVEVLAKKWRAAETEPIDSGLMLTAEVENEIVQLVLPQTYMNNSGQALTELRSRYEVPLDSVLVIFDDFQIPFGTLRFRPGGSDGGHNGMASMIDHAQNTLIPRLRIGVGGATMPTEHTHELMASYVLAEFDPEEQKRLPELLDHAERAVRSWITDGIQRTMSQYNRNFFTSAEAE